MVKLSYSKLSTASASGMLAILCGIFLLLSGILFIGFGNEFTPRLAPLFSGNMAVFAGLICVIFAILEFIGGVMIYSFHYYKIGGIMILLISAISIIVGGGFYISTLWGLGAGIIALICPSLENKINQD